MARKIWPGSHEDGDMGSPGTMWATTISYSGGNGLQPD